MTALAEALIAKRGVETQEEASAAASVPRGTLARLERGLHRPSYDTAVKLAKWLGWTVERVMAEAGEPASPPEME